MLFESLPREAGIATWRDLRQPCVPARSIAGIASAMLFGALRLVPLFPTPNLVRYSCNMQLTTWNWFSNKKESQKDSPLV